MCVWERREKGKANSQSSRRLQAFKGRLVGGLRNRHLHAGASRTRKNLRKRMWPGGKGEMGKKPSPQVRRRNIQSTRKPDSPIMVWGRTAPQALKSLLYLMEALFMVNGVGDGEPLTINECASGVRMTGKKTGVSGRSLPCRRGRGNGSFKKSFGRRNVLPRGGKNGEFPKLFITAKGETKLGVRQIEKTP